MRSTISALLFTILIISALSITVYYFEFNPISFIKQYVVNTKSEIPCHDDAFTQKDFDRDQYAWLRRITIEPFLKNQKKNKYTDRAVKFLDDYCGWMTDQENIPQLLELKKEGHQLARKFPKSFILNSCYGQILSESDDLKSAFKTLNQTLKLSNGKNPYIHKFFNYVQILKIHRQLDLINKHKAHDTMILGIHAWIESIKAKEFKPEESPIAYRLLRDVNEPFVKRKKWKIVYEKLMHINQVSPWLYKMIRGSYEIYEAWEHRGTGTASTVTKEGWAGFKRHLTKARGFLTQAWEMHPEYPEAASEMIIVAMAGHAGPKETEQLWFNRAVKAQMDYIPAYRALLHALRPRWGGSINKIESFGENCLATNRYDTSIPMMYLIAIRQIAIDLPFQSWRMPFKKKATQEKLDILFKNYLTESKSGEDKNRILAQKALVSAWQGKYEDVLSFLSSIKQRPDLKNGFCGKPLSLRYKNWEILDAEARAFTGPKMTLLKRAEVLQEKKDPKDSIQLFVQALEYYQGKDKKIFEYLRDRIAAMMLNRSVETISYSLVSSAAERKKWSIVKFLLDKGADINSQAYGGGTALHMACSLGSVKIVSMMIDRGAKLNTMNHYGVSPLHLALRYEKPDIAKLLIDRGADCHLKNFENWTPLHYAIANGQIKIANLLIKKGSEINAQTEKGFTPLYIAADNGFADMVKILMEKGADCGLKVENRYTAFMVAEHRKRIQAAKILSQYGCH